MYKFWQQSLFLLLKLFPKRGISHALGKLAKIQLPKALLSIVLRTYCRFYQVNMQESKQALADCTNFHQFFTRELRSGSRTVDSQKNAVLSPVDGVVSACGTIQQQRLLQVKGIYYTLNELLGLNQPEIQAFAQQHLDIQTFVDGFFATLYLSPKDYHRIHSPLGGTLKCCWRVGGELWPVNSWAVRNVPALYARNERLISLIQTPTTQVLLVAVGAMVVGSVHWHAWQDSLAVNQCCVVNQPIQAGEELGYFELGSTVILLFPAGSFSSSQLEAEKRFCFGEILGKLESL